MEHEHCYKTHAVKQMRSRMNCSIGLRDIWRRTRNDLKRKSDISALRFVVSFIGDANSRGSRVETKFVRSSRRRNTDRGRERRGRNALYPDFFLACLEKHCCEGARTTHLRVVSSAAGKTRTRETGGQMQMQRSVHTLFCHAFPGYVPPHVRKKRTATSVWWIL